MRRLVGSVAAEPPPSELLESGHHQVGTASAAAAVATRAAQSPLGLAGGQAHAGLTQAPICHGEGALVTPSKTIGREGAV